MNLLEAFVKELISTNNEDVKSVHNREVLALASIELVLPYICGLSDHMLETMIEVIKDSGEIRHYYEEVSKIEKEINRRKICKGQLELFNIVREMEQMAHLTGSDAYLDLAKRLEKLRLDLG